MKRPAKVFSIVLVIILLMLAMPMVALAAPASSPSHAAPDVGLGGFTTLVIQYASLAGFSALVAVLINVGKTLHIVADGTSEKWAASLNLLGLIVLIILRLYVPSLATEQIDGMAGQVATILIVVLGFVVQLYTSSDVHAVLANAEI